MRQYHALLCRSLLYSDHPRAAAGLRLNTRTAHVDSARGRTLRCDDVTLHRQRAVAPRGGEDLRLTIIGSATATGCSRGSASTTDVSPPGRRAPVRCALLCPECSRTSLWSVAP